VDSLLKAGFQVAAITRKESSATFPDNVIVKRVDITSVDSVKEALAGQDAVVSAAATAAAGSQKVIIDAAIAAKVPRFIPSEFGIPSRQNRDTKIGKILGAKIQNTDYLIELAEKHDWFSWTGLSNGLFLDSVCYMTLTETAAFSDWVVGSQKCKGIHQHQGSQDSHHRLGQ
jgi:hypothetical protein